MAGLPEITIPPMTCCFGLEDTIEAYVGHMVLVWRELWRVLRGDGVGFLNLGDSYYNGGGQKSNNNGTGKSSLGAQKGTSSRLAAERYGIQLQGKVSSMAKVDTLKPKDLIGIPWRCAFALQADGWYLRSDVIWSKKNPMPESCRDRPTKAHEYVFLLAKSERYWWDQEAIREGHSRDWQNETVGQKYMTAKDGRNDGGKLEGKGDPAGRNKRTVWELSSQPLKAAHFAVMPEALVEPCLLAGCPAQVCAECGEPWVRVVEKTKKSIPVSERHGRIGHNGQPPQISGNYWEGPTTKPTNIFTPTCQCCPLPAAKQATRPGVALDPFFGSGTVGAVAKKFKRTWLGIELNPAYIELAWTRLNHTQPALFAR
jgi:hypothetical protein